MDCKVTNRNVGTAFTLIEMLVSVSLGLLIVAGAGSVYIFSAKSFVSMSNHDDLSRRNRQASDLLSRDIRSATAVSSATRSQIVLQSQKGNVTYAFDDTAGTLTRSQAGQARVLLAGLTSLSFSLYQRPASGAAYEDFPAATASTASSPSIGSR